MLEDVISRLEEDGYRIEIKNNIVYIDGWAYAEIMEDQEIEADQRVLR